MTQEKFEHIIKIHHRLDELNTLKNELKSKVTHKLAYLYRSNDGSYSMVSEWKQKAIGDLLDKHDLMIRESIDQEIDQLNKEIESL